MFIQNVKKSWNSLSKILIYEIAWKHMMQTLHHLLNVNFGATCNRAYTLRWCDFNTFALQYWGLYREVCIYKCIWGCIQVWWWQRCTNATLSILSNSNKEGNVKIAFSYTCKITISFRILLAEDLQKHSNGSFGKARSMYTSNVWLLGIINTILDKFDDHS